MLRYKLIPQWERRGDVEHDKLLGGAADGPLVKLRGSTNQVSYGLGVVYSLRSLCGSGVLGLACQVV
jgi:outer membrane protein